MLRTIPHRNVNTSGILVDICSDVSFTKSLFPTIFMNIVSIECFGGLVAPGEVGSERDRVQSVRDVFVGRSYAATCVGQGPLPVSWSQLVCILIPEVRAEDRSPVARPGYQCPSTSAHLSPDRTVERKDVQRFGRGRQKSRLGQILPWSVLANIYCSAIPLFAFCNIVVVQISIVYISNDMCTEVLLKKIWFSNPKLTTTVTCI